MLLKIFNFLDFSMKNGLSRSLLILKNKFFITFPSFKFQNIIKFQEKGIKKYLFFKNGYCRYRNLYFNIY